MEHRPYPPTRYCLCDQIFSDTTAKPTIQDVLAGNLACHCETDVTSGTIVFSCCRPEGDKKGVSLSVDVPQEYTNYSCCLKNCCLIPGSQCAQEPCQENDGFKVAEGGQCRKEWCSCKIKYYNGSTAYCSDDVYCMNGLPRSNSKVDHYYGVCQSSDLHGGPPYGKDTSLRDGLLISSILVLPVVIIAALAVIKRDAIRRKFCRKHRRQQRDNNVQEPEQENRLMI